VKLNPQGRNFPPLVLAASLLVCFGMWRWAEDIAAPTYTAQALAEGRPIGNNSDLYPRWLGARELLLRGRDPYSAEVTREIQTGFYGRPLNPQSPSDPTDRVAFAYPLYVIFLFAPTVTLPFRTVLEMFRWLLLCAIGCSVPLWMYAVGFRARRLLVISGMVLAVGTFPAVQEFYLQNLTALVLLLLAGSAAATARGWLALSGFLLALSTIKPQLSGLLILWLVLWALGGWRERKWLIWSFVATIAVLLIASEVISPHWIARFLAATREYQAYAADPSIMQALLPSFLARLFSAALVGLLFALCWRWRKVPAGSEVFSWALAWVCTVTLAIIPKLAAYNQVLLIPAFLVLLAQREIIWKAGLIPRALVKCAFACQVWQWAAALTLSLSSLLIPAAKLRPAAQLPLYTSLASWPITLLAVALATFYLPTLRTLAVRHE
jgi:Glycosyltransferase family 87